MELMIILVFFLCALRDDKKKTRDIRRKVDILNKENERVFDEIRRKYD